MGFIVWFFRLAAASALTLAMVYGHGWLLGAVHIRSDGVISGDIIVRAVAFFGTLVGGTIASGLLATLFDGLAAADGEVGDGCLMGTLWFLGTGAAIFGLTAASLALALSGGQDLIAALAVAVLVFPCVSVVMGGWLIAEALVG